MQIWLRKYYNKTSVSLIYKLNIFDNIDFNYSSPISPMPLPEEGGEENVLVKMEGNTYTNRISWLIKDESTNRGNYNTSGSIPSDNKYQGSSKTIFEQLTWFTDKSGFVGTGLADDYDILFLQDNSHSGEEFTPWSSTAGTNITLGASEFGVRGYIRSLNFVISSNEPATIRASLEMIQGETPRGYQQNTPSVPRNFKVEDGSPASTSAYISYDTPSRDGGSAITGYLIYWRETNAGGDWSVSIPNPATSTGVTLTNLTTSTTYDFKVRAINANGKGDESYVITHTTS